MVFAVLMGEIVMRSAVNFVSFAIALAASVAVGGEAQEPLPTWSWPGPTPPAMCEARMKKTFLFHPTPQELKKIEEIAPERPPAVPARPRRILVWGRLWTHMANILTEESVKILGKKTGAFEVVAGDDPRLLLPDSLRGFDAVFFNGLHERHPFLPPWDLKSMSEDQRAAAQELDKQIKQSILKYVMEDGRGIAGIEGSIAALSDWKEYGEMMGAFYNGH
jgi:hypothetical protein